MPLCEPQNLADSNRGIFLGKKGKESMSANPRVLVVDDDKLTLRLSVHVFQRGGYEVFVASNGAEALEKVGDIMPDVVVLDVMMPDMSGLQVCKKLRANPNTSWLPIIMLSAKGHVDDKLSGFEAGADDYVQKPIAPKELLARVGALVHRSKRAQRQVGRVVSMVGTKGGVGVTTVAVNVALTLAREGHSVLLAEMRPYRGTAAHNLKMKPLQDVAGLLAMHPEEIDYQTVTRCIVQHASGLRLLVAPQDSPNNLFTPAHMQAILQVLTQEAEIVILDLPAVAGEATKYALEQSDQVMLITDPEPITIDCAKADGEKLKEWGVFDLTKLVVVSRARSNTMVAPGTIEKDMGLPVMGVLPPSPENFFLAASVGKPLVEAKPDALAAGQLVKLAKKMVEQFPVAVPVAR